VNDPDKRIGTKLSKLADCTIILCSPTATKVPFPKATSQTVKGETNRLLHPTALVEVHRQPPPCRAPNPPPPAGSPKPLESKATNTPSPKVMSARKFEPTKSRVCAELNIQSTPLVDRPSSAMNWPLAKTMSV